MQIFSNIELVISWTKVILIESMVNSGATRLFLCRLTSTCDETDPKKMTTSAASSKRPIVIGKSTENSGGAGR